MLDGETYADSAGDTLVFSDILALLYLSVGGLVDLLHAHVLLATAQLRSIDGDEETLDATRLSVLHILPGDLAVAVDVELDEELLVVYCGVDDLIEGARCESCDLKMSNVSKLGRSGDV